MRLCLLFENDAIDLVSSDTMARAAVVEKLDMMARAEDVILLENYCSPTVSEMLSSLVGEDEAGALKWFDPKDGLDTVRGLLAYLRRKPTTVRGVSADLKAFEKALDQAVRQKIKFRLMLDYGDVFGDDDED